MISLEWWMLPSALGALAVLVVLALSLRPLSRHLKRRRRRANYIRVHNEISRLLHSVEESQSHFSSSPQKTRDKLARVVQRLNDVRAEAGEAEVRWDRLEQRLPILEADLKATIEQGKKEYEQAQQVCLSLKALRSKLGELHERFGHNIFIDLTVAEAYFLQADAHFSSDPARRDLTACLERCAATQFALEAAEKQARLRMVQLGSEIVQAVKEARVSLDAGDAPHHEVTLEARPGDALVTVRVCRRTDA